MATEFPQNAAEAEGKQIMTVLGSNTGWLMKVMEAGRKEVPDPAPVAKVTPNFIR